MILSTATLIGLLLLPHVAGHGFVQEVTLGTTVYPGYHPYVDPWLEPIPDRIIRRLPGISPVEDLTLIDLQCNGETATGYATEPAALVGQIAAGDLVNVTWVTYASSDSHKGPLLTYMARAPTDIRRWNPGKDAIWFKVDHSGKLGNGKWAATDTFVNRNSTYTFRIPPNLVPGQYLIRHEWIALHLAEKYPGAQSYPACIQVEVTGSGTAFPTEFVSFPGAYKSDTPGIVYDVWNTPDDTPYPIPGPLVWTGGD